MSRYTKQELKEMAKVIMFNPNSTKSTELIMHIAMTHRANPQHVLSMIDKLTEGERL